MKIVCISIGSLGSRYSAWARYPGKAGSRKEAYVMSQKEFRGIPSGSEIPETTTTALQQHNNKLGYSNDNIVQFALQLLQPLENLRLCCDVWIEMSNIYIQEPSTNGKVSKSLFIIKKYSSGCMLNDSFLFNFILTFLSMVSYTLFYREPAKQKPNNN